MPQEIATPPARLWVLLREPLAVVLLVGCHLALGLSAIRQNCMTFDESAHFAGGFTYWVTNDYRLHPENGNWSQRWVGIPLWFAGQAFSVPLQPWQTSDVWGISELLFYASGGDADAMLWRARLMMVLPSALLALLVYAWSRWLWGALGGIISLAIYAFSPTMLANGFVITSDLFAALFFTASMAALWALVHRVTPLTFAAAAFAVSGLVLSKYSGVLIAPMAVLLVGVRLTNSRPLDVYFGRRWLIASRWRQLALLTGVAVAVTAVVVFMIWASYGFRYSVFAPAWEQGSQLQVAWENVRGNGPPTMGSLIQIARDYHLLPEGYLYGFSYTLLFAQQRVAFLNGVSSMTGWVSFFPYCLIYKTQLSLFFLLGAAAIGRAVYRSAQNEQQTSPRDPWTASWYALTPLVVLLAVYWIVALRTNLNIGHRHILPTYPAMFILAGAAATWFTALSTQVARAPSTSNTKPAQGVANLGPVPTTGGLLVVGARLVTTVRALVLVALAIMMCETLWIWPHYLAYFNVVAGGPSQGYRHLIDSSLDWGQDLKGLRSWLDAHPDIARDPEHTYLSYFGTARPEYYQINVRALPWFFPRWQPHIPQPLTGGVYCISASMLQCIYLPPYPGRWNADYEAYYRQLRDMMIRVEAAAADPNRQEEVRAAAADREMQESFRQYEIMRFSRLCSFLRQREPDDQVGYSILIYRLTDADIAQALDGDPVELLPAPETHAVRKVKLPQ